MKTLSYARAAAALFLLLVGTACPEKPPKVRVARQGAQSGSGSTTSITQEDEDDWAKLQSTVAIVQIVAATYGSSSSGSPASVSISPGNTLFGLGLAGEVLQYDLTDSTVVRSTPTGYNLVQGVASPGNGFLYLGATGTQNASSYSPSVRIFDLTTFQLGGSIPLPTTSTLTAMALTPDGKYLFVAGALTAQVFTDPSGVDCHLIDMNSRTLVKTFRFLGSRPLPELAMSPDGSRVFVTTSEGVAVIDTLTQTMSHTIAEPEFRFQGGPAHIAINPGGTSLFMAPVSAPGAISGVGIYDLSTSTRVKHIPMSSLSTMAMTVTADGSYLVIDHIVPDPATGRNDFPSMEWIRLPAGTPSKTNPWTASRDIPLTVHSLIPIPAPNF